MDAAFRFTTASLGPICRSSMRTQEDTVAAFIASVFQSVFQRAVELLPDGLKFRHVVPEGEQHAGRALLQAAREAASRLIVVSAGRHSHRLRCFVGGRHRGAVSRWLGSTTEGLLMQPNVSILVVPQAQ